MVRYAGNQLVVVFDLLVHRKSLGNRIARNRHQRLKIRAVSVGAARVRDCRCRYMYSVERGAVRARCWDRAVGTYSGNLVGHLSVRLLHGPHDLALCCSLCSKLCCFWPTLALSHHPCLNTVGIVGRAFCAEMINLQRGRGEDDSLCNHF